MTQLNQYQTLARRVYCDGDFLSTDDYRGVGDGLYTAIMTELSDSEDVENLENAIRRLELMYRQIGEVLQAFCDWEIEDEN